MVAHQTGGLGAASSSLVTPTTDSSYLKGFELFLFIHKNGLNRVFSEFLRIYKSLSRILKLHQKSNENNNKRLCVFTFLVKKTALPCKFKTGLIFCNTNRRKEIKMVNHHLLSH